MKVVVCVLAAALALAGCNAPSTPVAEGTNAAASSAQDSSNSTKDQSTDLATKGTGSTNVSSNQNGMSLRRRYPSAKKFDRPVKSEFPFETELDVRATVDRVCAEVGDKVTLTVQAPPEAAIAYQVVYSNNRGGADKPLGGGYGGNDKGYADNNGVFTDSWIIGPEAPSGIVRVDVVVGFEDKWGYDDPKLLVASSNGDGGPRSC